MAEHIQNSTFHILKKQFLTLSPIGWFYFPCFLLVGIYIFYYKYG